MSPSVPPRAPRRHLLWLYAGRLSEALDAATWVETTRSLRATGWTVTLVVAGTEEGACLQGVEVLPLPLANVYLVGNAIFHLRFLALLWRLRRDVDVVLVAPSSVAWLVPVRLVRNLVAVDRPLLVVDWRSLPMSSRDRATVKDRVRGWAFSSARALARIAADGQLTITRRLASALGIRDRDYWGSWPSGANREPFALAAAARHWPEGDEHVRVVYVGRLTFERHVVELALALQRANGRGARLQLLLVGNGPAAAELRRVASSSGGAVDVRAPVASAAIPDILASAHVGALPFPDEEKFRVSSPIKLFEYLASGLPVLATRIACHTDVVGDAGCAFWADTADTEGLGAALSALWTHRRDLPAMSAIASAAAPSWTWTASAERLRAALERHLTVTGREAQR